MISLYFGDNVGLRTKRYDIDISRRPFTEIEALLLSVRRRTKPRTVGMYEIFCAVLYLLRTVCQWRFLPDEFMKWQTVYAYFAKWKHPGQHGFSVLELALKKSVWLGSRQTGAQCTTKAIDRGRTECKKLGYGGLQGL